MQVGWLLFQYDDAGRLIGEYDESGNAIRQYVWLDDLPLAMLTPGGIYYLHADHLNTPRVATDGAGQIVWSANLRPFGDEVAPSSALEMPLRFPGQYQDRETGLHQNWHREYAPGLGRYTQSDPIGLVGGLNIYNYSMGRPLVLYDELGLAPCGCTSDRASLSAQGGLQGAVHVIAFGGSISVGALVTDDLTTCAVVTICGRLGPGLFIGGGGYFGAALSQSREAIAGGSVGLGGDIGFGAAAGVQSTVGVRDGRPASAGGIRTRGGGGFGFSAGLDGCYTALLFCQSRCE